jgi:hypothetical protein
MPQIIERTVSDPIELGNGVTGIFLFADEKFVQISDDSLRNWDGRRYVCVGLRIDHMAPWGQPCHISVSFANSPHHDETTDEWKVETRDPVTISPGVVCQAERDGQSCGFRGAVIGGKWIPSKQQEGADMAQDFEQTTKPAAERLAAASRQKKKQQRPWRPRATRRTRASEHDQGTEQHRAP